MTPLESALDKLKFAVREHKAMTAVLTKQECEALLEFLHSKP